MGKRVRAYLHLVSSICHWFSIGIIQNLRELRKWHIQILMHTSLIRHCLLPTIYYYYYYYYNSNQILYGISIWNSIYHQTGKLSGSGGWWLNRIRTVVFSSYILWIYLTVIFTILTSNVPINDKRLIDFNTIFYGLYDYWL